ncbi:hypothetical protein BDQ12DRAFT_685499 [Crucibulum laeve]|uniref:F-box domain-containing protein n=1 Tax=Crucibulum laeve TaxID=68775 RepID=A0A5C3LW26_9AGAR|nr:hypothetical protein BDQ12DRAFT_685499 [Crucibulum laeve]
MEAINDDVLVYIFSFLEPPNILAMRQTCRRMFAVSHLRIVWTNACNTHILQKGYPFPEIPLEKLSVPKLEKRTCHAYLLARKWLSEERGFRAKKFIDATSSTSVSDVRFVPGREDLLLTISKSIWSVITLWDVSAEPRKRCEWSPRGAIFNGFSLNSNPSSEATMAISILKDGVQSVKILSIRQRKNGELMLENIFSVNTHFRPINLEGDLLALSDEVSQIAIWNWRKGTYATLQHHVEEDAMFKGGRCIQVLFAPKCILVIRARSIYLFSEPAMVYPEDSESLIEHPIAQHSFGWVDGISVVLTAPTDKSITSPSFTLLVRTESDDPWSAEEHTLDLYTLRPNLSFIPSDSHHVSFPLEGSSSIPYLFPPTLATHVQSRRGSLRCPTVMLGRSGTSVWIEPHDRNVDGLVWDDYYAAPILSSDHAHEKLVAAVFPGPLNPYVRKEVVAREILDNDLNNWTSLDYDEELGRIALGSSFGKVMILWL